MHTAPATTPEEESAAAEAPAPRFAVLIPLEHPRGEELACLRRWTQELDYPRDDYTLLVTAPPHLREQDLEPLQELLGPGDRLIRSGEAHDIGLVAAAAAVADSELLVMTESHCIPEPDFLSACDEILGEHPEWDGFSGDSIPLASNALSRVEAAMYAADIDSNLGGHPWLKVLDQCFVIRRDAYLAAGGLEPEYGHFAEHLLAARLFRAGRRIGYDTRAAISHRYVGEIDELIEFAHDFGHGEARFARVAPADPCGDLFEAPRAWRERLRDDPAVARRMVTMLRRDLLRLRGGRRRPFRARRRGIAARRRPAPALILPWLWRAYASPAARRRWLELRMTTARFRLAARLLTGGDGARVRRAYERVNALAAEAGAREAIAAMDAEEEAEEDAGDDAGETPPPGDPLECPPSRSEWKAITASSHAAIGFYDLERVVRRPIRWSRPAAIVGVRASGPVTTIVIEWARLTATGHERARFYIDEQPLPQTAVRHEGLSTVLTVEHEPGPMRLGWVIEPARVPGDSRALGLPVDKIAWGPADSRISSTAMSARTPAGLAAHRRPPTAGVNGADPAYLLHITKTAGTSLRAALGNGFRSDQLLALMDRLYYVQQLPERLDPATTSGCRFAIGHFGMELEAVWPDVDLRLMTVLRDPEDRMRSLLAYLQEGGMVDERLSLTEWFADDMFARDWLSGFLTPSLLDSTPRPIAAVAERAEAGIDGALATVDRCEVVGLFERLDDSVDLLCDALGVLPPGETPHQNRRYDRRRTEGQAWPAAAARLLELDQRIYDRGVARFETQHAALRERLAGPGNTPVPAERVRHALRRRWFERAAAGTSAARRSEPTAWLASDPFLGDNVHPVEEHNGVFLHWTGPAELAEMHFLLDTARAWRLRVGLHAVADHLVATRLSFNGDPLEAKPLSRPDPDLAPLGAGIVLEARVEPGSEPSPGTSPFLTLGLRAPVRRGRGEARALGLALVAVVFDPVA